MDPILASIADADVEMSESGLALLRAEVEEFVRAGGQLTWLLWRDLDSETREAFVVASEKIRREQAVLAVRALASPSGGAELLLDGGDEHVSFVLDEAVDRIAAKRERRAG